MVKGFESKNTRDSTLLDVIAVMEGSPFPRSVRNRPDFGPGGGRPRLRGAVPRGRLRFGARAGGAGEGGGAARGGTEGVFEAD